MRNETRQISHYDATREEKLLQYQKKPEELVGVFRPMEYFMPYRIIEKELMDLLSATPNLHMLDVGCGDGAWAAYWAYHGFHVTYLDISKINIQIAELRMKVNGLDDKTYPVVGSASNLELDEDQFDVVVGFGILHHLTHEEEWLFWKLLNCVLKPSGQAFLMENLHNSKLLETLRIMIPVTQKHNPRPSIFSKNYNGYIENDPHPDRDDTTEHYRSVLDTIGLKYELEEIGIFSRLDRLTTNEKIRYFVHTYDYLLFKHIPFIKYFARNIVIKVMGVV